ncbi:hypothetical protein ACOME3_002360 [Neoechinorhynchus agilis]
MSLTIASLIGNRAPSFQGVDAVLNGRFTNVSLSDYAGKYVLLIFYPTNFSYVCPTEITAFNASFHQFTKRNCQILACSTESKYAHLAWTETHEKERGVGRLSFPLLSDQTKSIAKSYGILKPSGIACRCMILIDGNGIVRNVTVNDFPVGRNVDEALRLLDAFTHFEKNKEVCPANWTESSVRAIKPDIQKSKEYFEFISSPL